MRFNIKGTKTASSGVSRCTSCKHLVRVCGQREDERINFCSSLEREVSFQVSECTRFEEINTLSMYELSRMAWIIGVDKRTKTIGFYSPADYKKARDGGKSVEFAKPSETEFEF